MRNPLTLKCWASTVDVGPCLGEWPHRRLTTALRSFRAASINKVLPCLLMTNKSDVCRSCQCNEPCQHTKQGWMLVWLTTSTSLQLRNAKQPCGAPDRDWCTVMHLTFAIYYVDLQAIHPNDLILDILQISPCVCNKAIFRLFGHRQLSCLDLDKWAGSWEKGPNVILHPFAWCTDQLQWTSAVLWKQWHIFERPCLNQFQQFSKQFFFSR